MVDERPTDDAVHVESSMVPKHSEKPSLPSWVLRYCPILLLGLFAMAVILPHLLEERTGPHGPLRCCNELRQIGVALITYEARRGTFPAVPASEDADPLAVSWRVLVLPGCGESGIYNTYDFTKPWDSEENRALAEETPDIFHCLDDDQQRPGVTSYVRVVGPGTAWAEGEALDLETLKDSSATTVFVIEIQNSGIGWTDPGDLLLTDLRRLVREHGRVPSPHRKGFNVLFANGAVYGIKASIPEEALVELFSPAPNKSLPQKYLRDPF